ncbi:MAG: hypothetical protein IKQ36_06885 [Clostridia bacterium]|nr:hypothetical protein [Clostridia bacterium]
MNREKLISFLREKKSRQIQRYHSNDLYTIREVCNHVGALEPKGVDLDKKLSMVCCFEGVFLKDCLFVHYERDDDAVAVSAMNRGASALMCSHQIADYPCVIVDDVLGALNLLLRPLASKLHIPTIAITGSVGKTTTKNFINCVFSSHKRTFCNITNGNTFEYIGFELQRFDKKAKFFVQEVNESDPRNAMNSSEVLKPDIAVITNMDKSHIGELGSEENIMRAICEITAGMDENGIVIINADDPNSRRATFNQKTISVGIHDTGADCVASNIRAAGDGIEFDVAYNGQNDHLSVTVSGTHNVYDAMMAYVAGRLYDIPARIIRKGLMKYRPLGFRQNTYRAGGMTIYADCYNASAKSIRSALEVLEKRPHKPGSKKIAIIGDIGEIKGFEEDIYKDVADSISESDIDVLITYGTDTQMIHRFLSRDIVAYHTRSMDELCARIESVGGKNNEMLFKASRSMHLENAIKKTYPTAYIRGMMPVFLAYGKWTLKTL